MVWIKVGIAYVNGVSDVVKTFVGSKQIVETPGIPKT